MKKSHSPFDDVWTFAAPDAGNGRGSSRALNDTLVIDDGDPFPLAADTVTTVATSAAKPVASIATLADYLVNGFWQYNGTIAHHWASNTITYNINGLNAAEQFLALSALQAWHEVANITFVQTSGCREHHVQPQRHDAGLYQCAPGTARAITCRDHRHQLRLDHQ